MNLKRHQSCVDCHFFVQIFRGTTPEPIVLEIEEKNRDATRKGDYSWVTAPSILACWFGVWDEGFNFVKANRQREIVQFNRRRFCFWWKHRPGMMAPAAKVLQEREENERHSARDRRLTIIGLWIAAVALLINAWLTSASKLHIWPFK